MNGPVQADTCLKGTLDRLYLLFFCKEKGTLDVRSLKTHGYLNWAFFKNLKRTRAEMEKKEEGQNIVIP